MPTIQCVVVTPEATSLEQVAEFVVVPLYDGELGIASGHSPMIGRLGYGELRLTSGGTTRRFYVDGGFVQVEKNVVSILTGRVVPAEKLDGVAARELLAEAQKRKANTPELLEIRDRSIAQARAQIRLTQRN